MSPEGLVLYLTLPKLYDKTTQSLASSYLHKLHLHLRKCQKRRNSAKKRNQEEY